MKKPEFNHKFWIAILSIFALIIGSLLLWDMFFRYPRQSSIDYNGGGGGLRSPKQATGFNADILNSRLK